LSESRLDALRSRLDGLAAIVRRNASRASGETRIAFLVDREKWVDPNRANGRCPDHRRTKILGKRRQRLDRIAQILVSVL